MMATIYSEKGSAISRVDASHWMSPLRDTIFRCYTNAKPESWLHYLFFNSRDRICSEKSSVIRPHALLIKASVYHSFESLPKGAGFSPITIITAMTAELIEISGPKRIRRRSFPICLWIYAR